MVTDQIAPHMMILMIVFHVLQTPTDRHYSTYDEAHLKPIMQHIAKNVVVSEGHENFQVSWYTEALGLGLVYIFLVYIHLFTMHSIVSMYRSFILSDP